MKELKLPSGGYPLFDFQLIKNGNVIAVIEMQGIQHFEEVNPYPMFGKYEREVTDPFKRSFCEEHGLPFYEIKYTDNVQKKTNEIIDALYVNTVPSVSNDMKV